MFRSIAIYARGQFRCCRLRNIALTSLLAIMWLAWWLLPAVPVFRHELKVLPYTNWFHFASHGKGFACAHVWPGGSFESTPEIDIQVFEMPSFQLQSTELSHGIEVQTSPDGSQLLLCPEDRLLIHHLPSGPSSGGSRTTDLELVTSFRNVFWTNDGKHILVFAEGENSVFEKDSLKLSRKIKIAERPFAQSQDGKTLIGMSSDRKHFKVVSLDSDHPPLEVSLPGISGMESTHPPKDSVTIRNLAITNDRSKIFASLCRHTGDKNDRFLINRIARWSRHTNKWTESDREAEWCGPSGITGMMIDRHGGILSTAAFDRDFSMYLDERPRNQELDVHTMPRNTIWDATTHTPEPVNQRRSIPGGVGYFDPTGQRLIQFEEPFGTCSIYDVATLKRLAQFYHSPHERPIISPDGRWMAIEQETIPSKISTLSSWVPNWFQTLFASYGNKIQIIRLADGRVVQSIHLPSGGQYSYHYAAIRFLDDGCLWSARRAVDCENGSLAIIEKWEPESDWPWLMIMITGVVGLLIKYGRLAKRRTKL